MFGKWHLGMYKEAYTPRKRGFDEHMGYYQGCGSQFTHVAACCTAGTPDHDQNFICNVSGKYGEWIKSREGRGKNEHWTHPAKFGFPPKAKGSPFDTLEILWDSNWPADKKAYYNARKKVQTEARANLAAIKANEDATDKVAEVKREPTKTQKNLALKKQLEDLEK